MALQLGQTLLDGASSFQLLALLLLDLDFEVFLLGTAIKTTFIFELNEFNIQYTIIQPINTSSDLKSVLSGRIVRIYKLTAATSHV
jgi:hypothetical protein